MVKIEMMKLLFLPFNLKLSDSQKSTLTLNATVMCLWFTIMLILFVMCFYLFGREIFAMKQENIARKNKRISQNIHQEKMSPTN